MEEKRSEAKSLVEEKVGLTDEKTTDGDAGEAEKSDVEELREVLGAISSFLRDLEEPLGNLLDKLLEAINGARLGEEVGAFYRKLVDSGVPEEVAIEMTKEYFRERLSSVNLAGLLAKALRRELELEEE